jgi:hypothetical protein
MTDLPQRTVEDIAADLAASEAELDAGLYVSGDEVRAKLRATMARMRAKQRDDQQHGAARSR